MEHIYQKIHGWFTFPDLYKSVVEQFNNAIFVEIGTWKGKSAAFMAVEIANSKKNIKFYCVDTWTGETLDDNPIVYDCKEKQDNILYEHFLKNIEPVKEYIKTIKDYSLNASKQFKDNSIDFVFIDASHDYESVKTDLNTWYIKIKQGGILAGHDYNHDQVAKAVNEFCQNHNLQITSQEICWVLRKF